MKAFFYFALVLGTLASFSACTETIERHRTTTTTTTQETRSIQTTPVGVTTTTY